MDDGEGFMQVGGQVEGVWGGWGGRQISGPIGASNTFGAGRWVSFRLRLVGWGRVLIEQGRRGTAERQGSLLGRCRGWAEGARGFDLEGAYWATIVMRLARRTKCSSYLGGVSTSVMGLSSSL